MIRLSAPDVGHDEEAAVSQAVSSGWVAPLGPEVDAFECEIADFVGVNYAVAVSSGTAALHVGLLALGVKPGQIVITASMTFVATANAIRYIGAHPVFVDSQADGTLDCSILEEAIRSELEKGNVIGAIVPVDIYGKLAEYPAIQAVADTFGIPVLSDAAESVGSSGYGRNSGQFGKLSAFSFNGNKVMTTSGGGMVVTSSSEIAGNVKFLAQQAREEQPHYEHKVMGYNYRLSNVLAALGRVQLRKLPAMIETRRAWRSKYAELIRPFPALRMLSDDTSEENCWLSAIVFETGEGFSASSRLREFLIQHSVESRPLWKPMHLQPLYRSAAYYGGRVAETLFESGLVLPSGSGMSEEEFDSVSGLILDFLENRAWHQGLEGS